MATVTEMKCTCESCVCMVPADKAVMKEGKPYCSDACANGHLHGTGCGHSGCECHS